MKQGSTFGMNEMLSTTTFGLHKLQCIFIDPAENTSNTRTIKHTVDFSSKKHGDFIAKIIVAVAAACV